MEKRKYPRLVVNLPMNYHIHPNDSEECFTGKGLLADISMGGMFLKLPSPLPLEYRNVADFTIDMKYAPRLYNSRLKASAKVVRIESPEINSSDVGVAVQFLSRLTIQLI